MTKSVSTLFEHYAKMTRLIYGDEDRAIAKTCKMEYLGGKAKII